MNVLDSIRTVRVIVEKYNDKVNNCYMNSDSARFVLSVLKSVFSVLVSCCSPARRAENMGHEQLG